MILARCVQVQGVVTRGVVSQDADDAVNSEGNCVCGHEVGAYHEAAVTRRYWWSANAFRVPTTRDVVLSAFHMGKT